MFHRKWKYDFASVAPCLNARYTILVRGFIRAFPVTAN